jgi:hypothetical protein
MAKAADPGAAAEPEKEKKAPKVYGVVLVSIPDFPPRDPGRWLVYRQYPDKLKAEGKAKRLRKKYPEYQWKGEGLTHAGITDIKRRPIAIPELGVEVQFTASRVKVVRRDNGS